MSRADRSALPPVRLPSEDDLARAALATELLTRAAELARWAGAGVPVGAGGELPSGELKAAVTRLGLDAEPEGPFQTSLAWDFAVESGLVVIEETAEETSGGASGVATPGQALAQLADAAPTQVLDTWSDGVDAVLTEVAFAGVEELSAGSGGVGEPEEPDGAGELAGFREFRDGDEEGGDGAFDADELDWDPEAEADLLDSALGTLYLFTASDDDVAAGGLVPLPMVAAAVVMPEGADEPSEEVLDDVSAVVLRLDEQFQALDGTGLLEYVPADPEAVAAVEEDIADEELAELDEDLELERFGQVRLTPLGLYGVRRRMLEAGLDAPLVGDLRHGDAADLLAAIPYRPESAAREEAELWLSEREPLDAAGQLLAAARGADEEAPGRRLGCQLVLSLVDSRGEAALREVLDDSELGGLARVWLAERGAPDVPPPSEEMVFWLTMDTLAAQLTTGAEASETEELRELVRDLTGQHSEFFDRAWRSEHPATAEVLEAMGRLHPDRQFAKQARKAAFKARSRPTG